MGIINCYDDMDMILSDLSEEDIRRFVSGREFAVIRIEADAIHNHQRTKCGWKFYPKYIHHNMGIFFDSYALQIDDGDEASGRTYLFIRDTLPKFRETEDVSISYPTIEQLIPMLIGKRLIYYADFIEDRVGVDDVINKHLQKDVFNIRNKHEYYLYDSFFRVQIFLQKITNACTGDYSFMKPSDVRDYDLNSRILTKLKEECGKFYDDAVTLQYELVSEKLQAQYFLSKFHSNRRWELDPVCILNFRMSSFILPRTVSTKKAIDIPEDKIVRDCKTGAMYVLDSIHVNSDICSDLSEFNELIERFMNNIGLA